MDADLSACMVYVSSRVAFYNTCRVILHALTQALLLPLPLLLSGAVHARAAAAA
jgi:hypothetical protein